MSRHSNKVQKLNTTERRCTTFVVREEQPGAQGKEKNIVGKIRRLCTGTEDGEERRLSFTDIHPSNKINRVQKKGKGGKGFFNAGNTST